MRVHELAKELGVTAKELMETAKDKLDIVFKSHSATVSQGNADKIKAHYAAPTEKKAKPKAFIVKKAKVEKPVEEEAKEETREVLEPKAVVTRVTKTSIEKPKPPVVEAPKERPRLEIVRPAPKVQQKEEERPASRPVVRQHENKIPDIASLTRKNFGKNPAKEEAKNEDKKDTKQGQKGKPAAEAPKTPIKRHIISPDMYANQDFRKIKEKKIMLEA